MEAVLLIISLALFGIFALAAIGKFLDLKGSEKAVKEFGTPDEFARTFAIAIPFAELVFAFCFLFNETSWVGAIGGLILLVSFIGGIAWQIRQGKAPDCHCFGQIHSEPVGVKSLVRNIIFAILALVLVFSGSQNQGSRLGETTAQLAQNITLILIVTGLVVVVSYLKRLADQSSSLTRRVDLLELVANDGKPIERNEAGDPTDSLPIGAQFPDFRLPDARGRYVEFDHLLADPKPKLFLFVGPACEPCKALLPEIEEWRREFAERLQFVFVSSGSPEENVERFGAIIGESIILQKDRELAHSVFAKWTPAALLVGADGTVASHPAVGDLAMHDLIDRLRSDDIGRDRFYVSNGTRPGRIKIGQAAPVFSLKDLRGDVVTQEAFVGRKTLAVFLSTTCAHCRGVVEKIREWEDSPENSKPGLMVFSEGDRDLHLDFDLKSPVLIEKGYGTALRLGMFGVPSAVLVDEYGIIASEAAIGSHAIWSLIGVYD